MMAQVLIVNEKGKALVHNLSVVGQVFELFAQETTTKIISDVWFIKLVGIIEIGFVLKGNLLGI